MSNNKPRGIVFVLSGPSGVGKDAVRKPFMDTCPNMVQSVSATTRGIREGEENGVDYHFLTREKFEAMIREGEFLEFTQYNGNYYGTPAPFVNALLEEGRDVLLKIEVEGALNVKRFFPDAVLVFLLPPTMQVLWDRLVSRGTDDMEECRGRFARAYEELGYAPQYDYLVTNGDLSETVDQVRAIYLAEKSRIAHAAYRIDSLQQEVPEL